MGSCHSDSVKQLPTFITEIVSDHCTVLPCTLVSAVPWVSGKEVAVVVLRPGGHVTAAASWWREAAEPPPCRRLDQCVLTQCQAAGAQAMYSPMTQEFATLQDLNQVESDFGWFWVLQPFEVKLMAWMCYK